MKINGWKVFAVIAIVLFFITILAAAFYKIPKALEVLGMLPLLIAFVIFKLPYVRRKMEERV